MGDSEDEFRQLLRGAKARRAGRRGPGKVALPGAAAGSLVGQPLVHPDAAVAAVLQQELEQEDSGSLGKMGGLVLCQICQKDLSVMTPVQRQQHVNRCLDNMERLHPPSTGCPGIPACPICGKTFSTLKSRGSHLKRCAARMDVPPTLLLQAVQQQTSALGSGCPASPSGLKRKGVSSVEQPVKKRKTATMEGMDEDLLVAMAMSRSLLEKERTKAALLRSGRQDSSFRGRKPPKAGKKSCAKLPHLPPPLLLQDPEEARQETEERVALLLSEAEEVPGTPPLPTSQLLEAERLTLPTGPRCSLWECSSLAGMRVAPGSLCTTGSSLPLSPWMPDQRPAPGLVLPLPGPVKVEVAEMAPDAQHLQGRVCGDLPGDGPSDQREEPLAGSQKDAGILQDLLELAGEGLTLTQWSLEVQQAEESGQGLVPGDVLQSRSAQPLEEKPSLGSGHQTLLLDSLAAAFRGMVNNPHLSDVQFQVDSGEILYAHMFVLYARCPQLMEVVDREAFLVAEEGGMRTRRVLLHNIPAEAVRATLNYLYAGASAVPRQVLPDVTVLAVRFGMLELAALCRGQAGLGFCGEEEGGEERAESFEELLESMWTGEEEALRKCAPQEEADCEDVGEVELEEIYEFAATQRKAAIAAAEEGRGSSESERQAACGGASPRKGPLAGMVVAKRKGDRNLEPSQRHDHHARRELEGVKTLPLEPPQDAKQARVLGEPDAKAFLEWAEEKEGHPELHENSASLFSVAPEDCSELSQQSSDDLAPVSSQSRASPKGRGALSREPLRALSPVLSGSQPITTGKPCHFPERKPGVAPSRRAFGHGLSQPLCCPAPQSPPSHVNLEAASILLLDSDEEVELGGEGGRQEPGASAWQRSWQAAACTGQRLLPGGASEGGRREPLLSLSICRGATSHSQPLLRLSSDEEDSGTRGSSKGEKVCLQEPDTPLLAQSASGVAWSARPSLTTGPEEGRASQPAGHSGASLLLERHSLEDMLPACCRPVPLPACLPGEEKPASCPFRPRSELPRLAAEVVVVDDSEEEQDTATPLLPGGGSFVLTDDLPLCEGGGSSLAPIAGPERGVAAATAYGSSCCAARSQGWSPPRTSGAGDRIPLVRSCVAGTAAVLHFGEAESPEAKSQDWAAGCRDDSDGSEVLPLTQRLSAAVPVQKTPDPVCQAREVPCTTPLSPMPAYSVMETPELKKELSRFGVRALPKRRMVLKLKEIFQYTHQRGSADTKDQTSTCSQAPLPCRLAKAVLQAAKDSSTLREQPGGGAELPEGLRRSQNGGSRRDPSEVEQLPESPWLQAGGGGHPRGAAATPAGAPYTGRASQESTSSSQPGSDASLEWQSSPLTEFDSSTLAGEEAPLAASQAGTHGADKLEALRRYIQSKPALCRRILLYQPFELAGLQAELKQNGIRIALDKLLDFLDAHCITFTTAEARREKQQRRPKKKGRWQHC